MATSKTPKFDALLDAILVDLKPHERSCADCKKNFSITAEDIEFFNKLRVSPPTHCPDCRNKRRLSFANYSSIYKRKCDVPGHTDTMISPVAPVMPWVTYDYDTYYSDQWDPFAYARDPKPSETFFNQYLELIKVVPQPGVRRGADSPNSDFSFFGKHMKDCYYVFGGRRSEDVLYGSSIYDAKHAVDCYFLYGAEIVFNNVSTSDCYKTFYGYFSSNCIECDFIYDCRNCTNCFGSVNLRNKSYCWFNEQLTKEEYQKRREAVDLGNSTVAREYQEKFWKFVKDNPVRAVRIFQSENVSGNDIKRSKNCQTVFQTEDSENLRYTYFVIMKMKDSMDANHGGHADGLYETQNVAASSRIKFSFAIKDSVDCEYVMTCKNCTNCFGCAGLNNASYSIFNKRYEPDEYWQRLDEIKSEMLKRGEYGEFFPMPLSPVAYNSSMANIIFPITAAEAKSRGLFWQPETKTDTSSVKTIRASELPGNIKEVENDICDIAIVGEKSGNPFRLVQREIDFYKRYSLPLPTDTPYQRMLDRFEIMSNFHVDKDVCFKCGKEIQSAYKTSDGYKPYCAECFQEEFI